MAYRITRNEEIKIEDYVMKIRVHHDTVFSAIQALNAKMEEEALKVRAAIDALDAVKTEAAGFLEDIHREHEETFDLADEKWQESNRGQAVRDWLDELASQVQNLESVTDWEAPEESDPNDLENPAGLLSDLYLSPEAL